ncbi:hypothetical protein FEM08_06100 [Flavobacterium gilvum]|nr:hypothetical protein FEM08_06100 [Flavobacterium gilvum]
MVFRSSKRIKKHWKTNGVLRCSKSAIIIESTFPTYRNK